jgi:hypothetical protein
MGPCITLDYVSIPFSAGYHVPYIHLILDCKKMALAWMVSKENSSHCAGGILADDQVMSDFLISSEAPRSFVFVF